MENRIDQIGIVNLDCNSGLSGRITTSFYSSSCFILCFQPFSNPPVWSRMNCGQGCCKKSFAWCYNEEEGLHPETVNTERLDELGCEDTGPIEFCPGLPTRCVFTCI